MFRSQRRSWRSERNRAQVQADVRPGLHLRRKLDRFMMLKCHDVTDASLTPPQPRPLPAPLRALGWLAWATTRAPNETPLRAEQNSNRPDPPGIVTVRAAAV